jgi:Uma2 family endonuclease
MSSGSEITRQIWQDYEVPDGLRAEFFGGEIIMQANPTHLHDLVGRVFSRSVPEPFEAWVERGIDLGAAGQPRPDVAIARGEDIPETVRDWPVELVLAVVETVSGVRGAARRDYEDKREAYQAAAIPVYVIVDPRDATWLVLKLSDGKYEEHSKGRFGVPITLPEPLGISVPTVAFHQYPEDQR